MSRRQSGNEMNSGVSMTIIPYSLMLLVELLDDSDVSVLLLSVELPK